MLLDNHIAYKDTVLPHALNSHAYIEWTHVLLYNHIVDIDTSLVYVQFSHVRIDYLQFLLYNCICYKGILLPCALIFYVYIRNYDVLL